MNYEKELRVALDIASEAGSVMRTYFRADQQRVIKQDGSPVTVADTLINTLVIKHLNQAFPDDVVIGEEESTGDYGTGRRWLCDPVDGTKAYTWGVPTAMFSLALVIDGRPVLGVCYEPMLEMMYSAVSGEGAFCNGNPLSVSESSLSEGILAIASDPSDIRKNSIVTRILDEGITTAVFSGAVYKSTAVADGRFTGYIEHKVNAYDIAAIDVIVTEAGGRVTSLSGERHDYSASLKGVVVSNGHVHDELVNIANGSK